MFKICIQGEIGSSHHEAAVNLFGPTVDLLPAATFAAVFDALSPDTIGLVAIENSLYGSINEIYDLITQRHAQIFAETELSIHQTLIGTPGSRSQDIREIHSHPVALSQCAGYLDAHFPEAERIETDDTAGAVRWIVERGDPTKAAIASLTAARLYDAAVLDESIEDNSVNYTRFVAVARDEVAAARARDTSALAPRHKACLLITTLDQPGALYDALGVLHARGVNITKLESRPLIGEKWRYQFYLDFEADATLAHRIIDELRAQGVTVTTLGLF